MVAGCRVSRMELVEALGEVVRGLGQGMPVRVAVDGPDAAGKTTLADDLAVVVEDGRPVIRMSLDGFHRPRSVRYRRGPLSPEGYFLDSFDLDAFREVVLDPLGSGGNRRYQRAIYDHVADRPLADPAQLAPADAVLLVDGVFLLREELRDAWDLAVYLDVDPAETTRRALLRDVPMLGDAETVRKRYEHRYLPGQHLYRTQARPADHAHIVIDNNDPHQPIILTWPTHDDRGSGRPAPC